MIRNYIVPTLVFMGGLFVLCWVPEIWLAEVSLHTLQAAGRTWNHLTLQSLTLSLGLYAFGGALHLRLWATPFVVLGFLAVFVPSHWWQLGKGFYLWAISFSLMVTFHHYLLLHRKVVGNDQEEQGTTDKRPLMPLSNRIAGIVVIVLSVMFLIVVALFHIVGVSLGFGRRGDEVFIIASLYISVVNVFIWGTVLWKVSFEATPPSQYRRYCFLVCGFTIIGFGGLITSLVMPLDRFQGLRQEAFIGYGSVLGISFFIAFLSTLKACKKTEGVQPQFLDSSPPV